MSASADDSSTPLESKVLRHGGERCQALRELEDENRRLKQRVADLSLDYPVLKDVLKKKW